MAKFEFQTEVNDLLQLIIHSLYSNKDIFLREIVSNASDALDKLKYLTLSDEKYKNISFDPRIDIVFDEKEGTLTVYDNGIGMNENDLQNNLGTIARSGTKSFIEKLKKENTAASKDSSLIGQFGVGFYSAFMVSKKLTVFTRKALEEKLFKWTSDGKSQYELEQANEEDSPFKIGEHGTAVVMELNDGEKNYASRWRIEELIKKYSDHIAFPIFLTYTKNNYDDKGNVTGSEEKCDKLNSASALWRRNKSELKKEDYIDFYKSFQAEENEPLLYVHTQAEGTQEYVTLFFVPAKAPFDMYQADYKSGVKLFVKRVFITDDDKELLPSYLRFVRGVIDSEDLPLNVSREILQQNRILQTIKNQSVKKLLGEFSSLSKKGEAALKKNENERNDEEKAAAKNWLNFVREFNRPMKEGLYSDFSNRDEIAEIVRFKSTHKNEGENEWTSLKDYVSRMKDGQKAIYYITGQNEKNLRENPLVKAYVAKGFEVLIMADEIDGIVIPSYGKYKDWEMKAVNRAGSGEEIAGAEEGEKEEDSAEIVAAIKEALGDKVKDVRSTKVLGDDTACCIVTDTEDPMYQMQMMMKMMGKDEIEVKPILEVNVSHAFTRRVKGANKEAVKDIAEVLLGQALLLAGRELSEPALFVRHLNSLL